MVAFFKVAETTFLATVGKREFVVTEWEGDWFVYSQTPGHERERHYRGDEDGAKTFVRRLAEKQEAQVD